MSKRNRPRAPKHVDASATVHAAGVEPKAPPHRPKRTPSATGRRLRAGHLLLAAALPILLAAHGWLGREMFERYRFNIARYPDLAAHTQWKRATAWMPAGLQPYLTRALIGRMPPPKAVNTSQYIEQLTSAALIFPYDGILQLERARQIVKRPGNRRQALEEALACNRRAFETYFDIEAYNQMAWTHMELAGVLGPSKAREQQQAAIEGFERVLVLKPGDVDALERLAWIHSSLAGRSKDPNVWRPTIQYALQILKEEHDNTNAYFLLGLAYDNLQDEERAATYYFKTVTLASTTPPERRMWKQHEKLIVDHLRKLGFLSGNRVVSTMRTR